MWKTVSAFYIGSLNCAYIMILEGTLCVIH